jgi:hypothetical protein
MSTLVRRATWGMLQVRLAIVAPAASWAVVDHRKSLWTVPEPMENATCAFPTDSLDGAENAPPTTAHKAVLGFTEEEQMRKMMRLSTKGGSRG